MLALRILGGVFAVALFGVAVVRYRRRQISRLSLIITWFIALAVLLLAIAPSMFNPLFELFNFQPRSGQRLTAVLLFAVVLLFALVIRMQAESDTNERSIRLLVEALGQQGV